MTTNGHEWDAAERDGFLCRMVGRCARLLGMSPAACAVRIGELSRENGHKKHEEAQKEAGLNVAEQRAAFLEGLQGAENTGSRIREACPTKNGNEEGLR